MQDDAASENREQIFGYISSNPGSHLRKIARELDIRLSTLRYHLDHLEKSGLVVSQKQNNLKIYFASGKLKPEEKALTQLLQQKRFRDIILILIDSPGSTFSQIAQRLSMSPSTASKYINILEDRDVLSHEKVGKQKRYRIKNEKSVIELLKTYKKLMADMSYEIRMPMNAIVGMTSLLLSDDMTPEQKDFVETIRISADALMAVVNDILDFSKIEREDTGLEIQTFNLRGSIEDALQSFAGKAAAKRLNLAYLLDKISPNVIIGDPKKLRQILVNLLDHAVNNTRKGEVTLFVSSTRLDPLYEIHFQIKDTGPGIPSDRIDHLFDSGIEPRAANKSKGMPQGFAESKGLVELMSGRIWAESRVGEGSTIHFTIKTKHVPNISPLTGVQLPLDGKRILILDGSKTIRDFLAVQAGEWGMIPITIAEKDEALGLLQGVDPFDIALLDTSRSLNGALAAAKDLRKADKSLPLVAITFAGQQIGSDLFAASLTKPIRQADLFNCLSTVFSGTSHPGYGAPGTPESARPGSMRVLLAEDNLSNQKVILMMLKRLGYPAKAVSSGKEALHALESEHFDAVLMDVRMPEMDGLEATRIIRQRWNNKLKIIAITAYALKGDRERCLAAGMDDYISKPVKMEELAEMLSKFRAVESS